MDGEYVCIKWVVGFWNIERESEMLKGIYNVL